MSTISNRSIRKNALSQGSVRDLVLQEYRKHRLRHEILKHGHLDIPLETAVLDREAFLKQLSELPGVGPKAIRVLSCLLEKTARELDAKKK